MRAAALLLAVCLLACGREEVVTGEGMTPEERLEMRQQAVKSGISYIVDCGLTRTPYGGECLLFDGPNFTGLCSAIGGGASQGLTFDEPTASWGTGKSFNDAVRSHWCSGKIGGNCVVLHTEAPFWGPAMRRWLTSNQSHQVPNEPTWLWSSFISTAASTGVTEATCIAQSTY